MTEEKNMGTIFSCPSCSRRLSANRTLPAEALLQCPACHAAFPLSAVDGLVEGKAQDDPQREIPSWRSQGEARFSEAPLYPTRPQDNEPADWDDRPPGRSSWDDHADDDWPEERRPQKKEKSKRLLVFGGGFGLVAIVVSAVLWSISAEPDVALVGSWKGTFDFDVINNIDCTYRFDPDGSFVEEHVDPDMGIMVRATGRYTQTHGQVNIQWRNGGFERATVRRTGPDAIEYVIVAHSDRAQIGGIATFSRVGR